MSRSGPGPETAPEPDQNSRPRRTSTTRTFFDPSPSASAAARSRQPVPSSSTHAHTHNNINSHYHPKVGSSHSSLEPNPGSLQNISESESEDDEGDEMRELSKLELRRAKNRLKQRNLRHRRATHVSQLEEAVRSLKRDVASLREHTTLQTTVVTSNETKYRSWLSDLEAFLFRQGQGQEVERARQSWQGSIQAIPVWTAPAPSRPGKGGRKSSKAMVKQEPRNEAAEVTYSHLSANIAAINNRDAQMPVDNSARRGSLSTLVQAAMASDLTRTPPTPSYNNNPSLSSAGPVIHSTYSHRTLPNQQTKVHLNQYQQPQPRSRYLDQNKDHDHTQNQTPNQQQQPSYSKPMTVYPGSLQALSNPPSLPRHPYRSRTIPTSRSGSGHTNTSTSAPSAPNTSTSGFGIHNNNHLYPEDPSDRKRKRSLSGPTLHSSRMSNELPPILPMSFSAPSSGMIPQSFLFSHTVPPLPLGPPPMSTSMSVLGAGSQSRPSSSHQSQTMLPRPTSSHLGQNENQNQALAPITAWNTLAPFRPQTAPSSRPHTPSTIPFVVDTLPPRPRIETSPQHMSIANLISPTEGNRQ